MLIIGVQILSLIFNTVFLFSSAKKEEEDLEDKKSLKKRIKELKVLDPKIAQNLCKFLFPLSPLISRFAFKHVCESLRCIGSFCHSVAFCLPLK